MKDFVILTDSCCDLTAQLADELVRDTRGSAKISAMQSTFPSATKYGMAALLPHFKMTLADDMRVLCDGLPTDNTRARGELLKKEGQPQMRGWPSLLYIR